jgi:hypothetical protein
MRWPILAIAWFLVAGHATAAQHRIQSHLHAPSEVCDYFQGTVKTVSASGNGGAKSNLVTFFMVGRGTQNPSADAMNFNVNLNSGRAAVEGKIALVARAVETNAQVRVTYYHQLNDKKFFAHVVEYGAGFGPLPARCPA